MKEYLNDFPMLKQNYVYFNSASTSYKPQEVIDTIVDYYQNYGVNTNRGVDSLGFIVTNKFEDARKTIANFINAKKEEIVFTRGTTESINLVVNSFENNINENDEVIISIYEHHSNFVPWQQLCLRKKARLIFVDTYNDGTVNLDDLRNKLNKKTKFVALNHVSNVFGGNNKLKEIAEIVHKHNAYLLIDGAQGILHEQIDVVDMDMDFYAFSGHKIYGPMGVGVLYGKSKILNIMKPTIFGGEMIESVNKNSSTFKEIPYVFEAGTMMVPEALGLETAIKYFNKIGYKRINKHIFDLREYLIDKLKHEINNIEIYNENNINSNLITFNIINIHSHDVATVLDNKNIIVRAGNHCAHPLFDHLNINSSIRVSLAIYNTYADCDKLTDALKEVGDYLNVLF